MNLEHWRKQLLLSEEENEANDWLAEVRLMVEAVVESRSGEELDLYDLAKRFGTTASTCRGILENHRMVNIRRGRKGKEYRSKAPPLFPTPDGLLAEAVLWARAGSLGEQAVEDFYGTLNRGKKKRSRVVERY